MPRVAIEDVRRTMVVTGNTSSRAYVLDIVIFGTDMPEGRPLAYSQVEVLINFDDNRAAARAAGLVAGTTGLGYRRSRQGDCQGLGSAAVAP